MKKLLSILILLIIVPAFSYSQLLVDAYRLSSHQINGTARASSMGNAFGALGGDFTSLSINPAGIAVYRSSEFVVTPTLKFNESEAIVGNNMFSDNKYQLKFNNVGYVGTFSNGTSSKLVSFNFGIGVNDVLDFNQYFFMNNDNSSASFLDDIVGWANSEAISNSYLEQNIDNVEYRDWPTKLAWDAYLIDPVDGVDGEYVNILYENEKVNQSKTYAQKGGIKEYVFSGGLNFNHTFYLGATLGIHDVNISQLTDYTEILEDGASFTFTENQYLEGTGYNLKLGVIYKPINEVRLGVAFHTPTYYTLLDEAYLSMDFDGSPEGLNSYEYDFVTPMKTILSGAVVINKMGLISMDAEIVDYRSMRFRNGGYYGNDSFTDLNGDIDDVFKTVVNLRIGGELKVNPQFGLRAGYEFYGNPYKNDLNEITLSDNRSVVSAGLGYASKGFFADLAYRKSLDKYNLYNIQPNFEDVGLNNNNNKILFTLGFKF